MDRVQRTVEATPAQVWGVLADGWLYPLWVVGATRMRQVDDGWPEAGARLHHSVGVWPLVIDDETEVVAVEAGRRMHLRARAWPTGEAEVILHIEDGGGATSKVAIEEDLVAGPARLVPPLLRSRVLRMRNRETLRRLAWLAERRT
jgi:uncharacterized protein YndB with AHSA1/START domain